MMYLIHYKQDKEINNWMDFYPGIKTIQDVITTKTLWNDFSQYSLSLKEQYYHTTAIITTLLIERIITQNVVKLIQVVFPRKDWPVRQHLSQDATHWPDVYGLGIALREKGTNTQSGLQDIKSQLNNNGLTVSYREITEHCKQLLNVNAEMRFS